MINNEIFGSIAVAISVFSDLFYVVSIFKGHTKPHVFSWFIWGILSTVIFLAQVFNGGGPGAWVTGFSAFGHFFICALALFKGEKNITRNDWICFITALITIPLWYFTKTPLYSIMLIVIIDLIGFIPTIRKSFSKPYEEPGSIYALSVVKHIIASMGLKNFSLITALYPLSMILVNGGFALMLFWRRSVLRKKR